MKNFYDWLKFSMHVISALLKMNEAAGRSVTEEEIVARLRPGCEVGLMKANVHQMVQNIFH